MAQIKNKDVVASLLTEGIKAVAEQTKTIIELVDPDLASRLQIEPRTLRGWKTPSGIPNSIDDERLLGLVWLILAHSNKDLEWMLKLLKATSVIVIDPPTPEWVRSCMGSAAIGLENTNQIGSPAEAEIERIIKRLFRDEQHIKTVVNQPDFSPPPSLPRQEVPGEVIPLHSHFYIERFSDGFMQSAIYRQGVTLIIKAPRQLGKTSLLLRTSNTATKLGKRVALMDFQLFDRPTLNNPTNFYRQFCNSLGRILKIENHVEEYWAEPMTNVQRCTAYLSEYLLPALDCQVVLAIDEVDHIFDTDLRSDFFAMLRHWHNSRQMRSVWQQLDLILVTSTQPYQLIENLNQSPFNVGETTELEDFRPEQISELGRRYTVKLKNAEEQKLINLLGGQPYLVQQAFYLLSNRRYSMPELLDSAIDDRGPFGEHLRALLQKLHQNPRLVEGMRQILSNGSCPDEIIYWRLHGAGLVKRVKRQVMARYQLYDDYFRDRLF